MPMTCMADETKTIDPVGALPCQLLRVWTALLPSCCSKPSIRIALMESVNFISLRAPPTELQPKAPPLDPLLGKRLRIGCAKSKEEHAVEGGR
jgi:hypothetical protein